MKLNFKNEKNFKIDENEFICEYIEKYIENINIYLTKKIEIDLNFYYIVERILLMKIQIFKYIFNTFSNISEFNEIY